MWFSQQPPPSDHVLTDGNETVSYGDLPHEFLQLDELWRGAGNDDSHHGATVLACRNDVRTAVAALYLLAHRQPCYFWRAPSEGQGDEVPWNELPEFCSSALLLQGPSSRSLSQDHDSLPYQLVMRGGSLPANPLPPGTLYLGTSGTTARPKLAVYSLERMLGNAANCVNRFELSSKDRVLLPLPIAHMYGFGAAFLPAVLAGASIHFLPVVNIFTLLRAEEQIDPTVIFLTPGLAHQFISVRRRPRRYRLSVMGADRMNPDTFARYEELHGCTVCVFGSTETGALSASRPTDSFSRRQQAFGPLMEGARLIAESEPDTPEGTRGHLLSFAFPYGMAGYADPHGKPIAVKDDIYPTRDLGELDEHGDLRVYGRCDDNVKRDGYLVAFSDIERAMERLPGIARVIVTSGEETPRGVAIIAFCLLQTGASPEAEQVLTDCRRLLADHAIPDRVVFVDQLPLMATGKPDRQALKLLDGPNSTTPSGL